MPADQQATEQTPAQGLIAKWINDDERAQLIASGEAADRDQSHDQLRPLICLFQPDGKGVWLIASLDPAIPDIAYGLADLGIGCPEVGEFMLSDLADMKGNLNLAIERDKAFKQARTLDDYDRNASALGRILR